MVKMPTEEELKAQLMSKITEEQFNSTLQELVNSNPLYRKKRILAYPMIAKKFGITLDIPLNISQGPRYANTEIMNKGEFVKIGDLITTPFRVVNIKGWIIDIGNVGTTKAGDKPKVSFKIGDETGITEPIWIFGSGVEDFINMAHTKIGMPIDIYGLPIKDDTGKLFMRFESGKSLTTMTVASKEQSCKIGDINIPLIAGLDDGYTMVKGIIMGDITTIIKTGCNNFHYLEGKPGEMMPCAKCNGVPKQIMEHKSGKVLLADESGQLLVDIPAWKYPTELEFGKFYIISGKYDKNRESLTYQRHIVVTDIPMGLQNTATKSLHQQLWEAVKNGYTDKKDIGAKLPQGTNVDEVLKLFIQKGVFQEDNNKYSTIWDNWKDVSELLQASTSPEVEVHFGGFDFALNDDKRNPPSEEAVGGFLERYKTQLSKTMSTTTALALYQVIDRLHKGQNYKLAPFVDVLLMNNVAQLKRHGEILKLVAVEAK